MHSKKTDRAVCNLFGRYSIDIFYESVRVVQVTGTNRCVFFSDVYGLKSDAIDAFMARCNEAGISVSTFEKLYPGTEYSVGFMPPSRAGIEDYPPIYRGRLSGVVVG